MNVGERLMHILEGTGMTVEEFFKKAHELTYPYGVYDTSHDALRFHVGGIVPEYVAQVVRQMQTY